MEVLSPSIIWLDLSIRRRTQPESKPTQLLGCISEKTFKKLFTNQVDYKAVKTSFTVHDRIEGSAAELQHHSAYIGFDFGYNSDIAHPKV